jgi:hypothetical protein
VKANPSVKEVWFSEALFKYPTHEIEYTTTLRGLRGCGADAYQGNYFGHDL